MNAYEARQLSDKASDIKYFKDALEEVVNEIKEAANKGLFTIRTEHIHPLIESYFKELGYDVKYTSAFLNSIVRVHMPALLTISW